VTVHEWVEQRAHTAPGTLVSAMLDALSEDARLPAERAGDACVAAAARALDRIVTEHRFERDSALPLLAVDALATLAFEHAAEYGPSVQAISAAAARGIHALGTSSLARV